MPTSVRFIDAVAVKGVLVTQTAKGGNDIQAERRLPDALEQAFDQSIQVLAFDEAHLEIHLGELELPVRALIFIAETTGQLIITLDARNHRICLNAVLRQGIKPDHGDWAPELTAPSRI
jgi:hypothetical protein